MANSQERFHVRLDGTRPVRLPVADMTQRTRWSRSRSRNASWR